MKNFAVIFLLLTSTLTAEENTLFQQAQTALAEGIPQVGIQKLNLYLKQKLPAEEIRRVQLTLAQAYLAVQQTDAARNLLNQVKVGEDVQFLLTQADLADKKWRSVTQRLVNLPTKESLYYAPNLFARAEAFRGLEQKNLAKKDYQLLENDPQLGNAVRLRLAELSTENPTVQLANTDDLAALQAATLLTAEANLRAKKFTQSEHYFRSLLDNPSQLTSSHFTAVHLGLARSLAELGRLDEASDLLEKFISERPHNEQLNDIFAELNRTYEKQKNPSPNQLRRWSKDVAEPARQALSIYYQSLFELRDKGSDAALDTLANWLSKFPTHPLRASVLLRYGEQLIFENKLTEGIRNFTEGLTLPSLPITQGELHVALARALFSKNEFSQAATHFQTASKFLTRSTQNLLYNTALCWLRDSNFEQFLIVYQSFSNLFPESNLRRDLLIEEGFFQARSGETSQASDTLNLFIRDFPEHPRIPDAHLALAELSLENSPSETEQQLVLASQSMPSPEVSERTAYLRFFQKNADGKEKSENSKPIEKCLTFLQQYPKSTFEAEVRFKLGEAYFAEKNYTAAGTEFELISSKFPNFPLLEQARFLAGQSAIRTMNPSAIDGAISLFEQVVRMKGPLQAYARFEQANVKKNNGAYDEAIVLYNDLLNQKPPDDLLSSTLAAKGETLYLQGSTDATKITESAETFSSLATLPGVSLYWRNLALYKKGKALDWLGRKEDMLAAYYDALTLPANSQETYETYWFYRAGFDAAESLEADAQWEAAIAIYRKLSAIKGPRSSEAEERIKRLRLEHFIWEK